MKESNFARAVLCIVLGLFALGAQGKTDKPNILVIWGDDIGWSNLSVYHRGMIGGSTPNIDRIANEGAMFTDYYGEQSCTAGRSAFVTGQHPLRTGLLKVGAARRGYWSSCRRSDDRRVAQTARLYQRAVWQKSPGGQG